MPHVMLLGAMIVGWAAYLLYPLAKGMAGDPLPDDHRGPRGCITFAAIYAALYAILCSLGVI